MMHNWVWGKHAYVDLTGVPSFVGLEVGVFMVWQIVVKAASSKVAKHEKACSDNQHTFIPLVFDIF